MAVNGQTDKACNFGIAGELRILELYLLTLGKYIAFAAP